MITLNGIGIIVCSLGRRLTNWDVERLAKSIKTIMPAREEAAGEAEAAECLLWSEQMEGFSGPAQPSPTIAQCLNGGYGWLEVMCKRCETRASPPLDAIRRPRDTPIWKLEAALKCRSCKKGRYAPPVHMIKLTEAQEITPCVWVHPDEDR